MIDVSCVLCMWKMCCDDIGRMDGQTADINIYTQGAQICTISSETKELMEISIYEKSDKPLNTII